MSIGIIKAIFYKTAAPPQDSQLLMSILNTRFKRDAQVIAPRFSLSVRTTFSESFLLLDWLTMTDRYRPVFLDRKPWSWGESDPDLFVAKMRSLNWATATLENCSLLEQWLTVNTQSIGLINKVTWLNHELRKHIIRPSIKLLKKRYSVSFPRPAGGFFSGTVPASSTNQTSSSKMEDEAKAIIDKTWIESLVKKIDESYPCNAPH